MKCWIEDIDKEDIMLKNKHFSSYWHTYVNAYNE